MNTKNLELLNRALRAVRRSTLIWLGALLLLVLSVLAVWPSMRESGSLDDLVAGLSPELIAALGLDGLGSPVGYLNGNLYALLLPLALGALGIMQMHTLTAGDEDAGRLELLLALPVGRVSVFLMRFLAVLLVLLGVGAVLAATVLLGSSAFDMRLEAEGVVAANLAITLLAVWHASLVLALAGLGLRSGAVLGVSFGVLVLGYIASALLPLAGGLDGLEAVSPWRWALGEHPLERGFDPLGTALLLGGSLVLLVIGLLAVRRRTIRSA